MAGAIATTRIEASAFGYVMPVAVIPSGSSVAWESTDSTHITEEGLSLGDNDHCFSVLHAPGDGVSPIVFTRIGAAVFADDGNGPIECLNTRALATGDVAVPFYCTLHPTMRGTLVVTG